jgi:CubicO group peptidase (beta-lactamase class C family)/predicted dienelactone hydrolase
MVLTKRIFCLVIVLMLAVAACQPVTRLPAREPQPPTGLRLDAPPYAVRGPFAVGYRTLAHGEGTAHPLEVSLWYPALNPAGEREAVRYDVHFKAAAAGWSPAIPPVVYGHALLNAAVDASQEPYPLVVLSHGFSMSAAGYSATAEHYASNGFFVLAPEHMEQFDFDWSDLWKASIDRPGDIKQTLDFAEALTAPDGDLAGFIDMERVAVVGHSYGGYTALAMAGAQYDLAAYNARCAQIPEDDPLAFLCTPLVPMEAEMADRAGLDPMPEGLWPSFGDPRVKAIIPMTGDSYLFDQAGLAKITIPMMAMGGTADTGTPYEWGTKPAYDYASSEQKTLVAFEGAEHMIFTTPCDGQPWMSDHPAHDFFCFDPVWDRNRALDLVHHFSTAFLLDTLKGDQAAHAALLPENVSFPGIHYETTTHAAQAHPAASILDEETVAKLEAVVEQGMQDYHTPGIALGVVKNGELVYAKGFGVAELGSERPVTPQTVFCLASIAKTVTSTAILQLVEQGKINLDAPVTDYLPYFELADERDRDITIRQLLSHTAGLTEWDYFNMGEPEFDEGALERYVRSLRDVELLAAPGEQWEYSGIGYDILGDVVAKVSGQSFETYVDEHIFTQLGMAHSTFMPGEVDPAVWANPHIPDEAGNTVVHRNFEYTRSHAPDSTLCSTVEETARYAMAHLNRGELDGARILDASTYDESWKSHGETWFPPDLERNYGLGWTIGDYKGHLLIGHGGLDFGYNAFIALLPDEATAVVMLTNYSLAFTEDVTEWVLPAFFLREPILDAVLGIEQ